MKTNAEYKQDERNRKRKAGLKKVEYWIYPVDEPRFRTYVYMITEETKINKNNA